MPDLPAETRESPAIVLAFGPLLASEVLFEARTCDTIHAVSVRK